MIRCRARGHGRATSASPGWFEGLIACVACIAWAVGAARAAGAASSNEILMTYWSDDTSRHAGYPLPGSVDAAGMRQDNSELLQQLDVIDVLAYAFLQVDLAGNLYFRNPRVDLSTRDGELFCRQQPATCPNAENAMTGSFDAFARLTNGQHALKKIISVGGADSQRSLEDTVNHLEVFIGSAVALIHAYRLDGIDLDFEPDTFFGAHQGERIAEIVSRLRKALGDRAFISIEVPADWETLRSFDCPSFSGCSGNLASVARNGYVSLMGYSFHGPDYPGPVTGNDSALYSDPEEPLVPGFYHASDEQAIEYLTFRKVPVDRILLGYPGYFVAYGGVQDSSGAHGLYQPFDRSKTPTYDIHGLKGIGSYRVAETLLDSGLTSHGVFVNDQLSAVYAYDPSKRLWISYENAASVASKARYVLAKHLAGMMMWEIGEDLPISNSGSLLRSARENLARGPTR
jgi:GH18 family chitinase